MSSPAATIARAPGASGTDAAGFPSRTQTLVVVANIIVILAILGLGALQVVLHKRATDFQYDDVAYFLRARSMVRSGFDGFNGQPETNQPPGLPLIFASLWAVTGDSYGSLLSAMAVFGTLGFIAAYLLLRRQMPMAIATAVCLVLLSSPIYFDLGTRWLAPACPLFLVTMCALLVAGRMDQHQPTTTTKRIALLLLLGLLTTISLMISSASIALLGAAVASVAVAMLRDRPLAFSRLKTYGAMMLLGLAFQGMWMFRKPAPLEWPLPGYPRPYLQQLLVKNGHDPELGSATWRDLIVRVEKNTYDDSVLLAKLIYPHWINAAWPSVPVAAPLFVVTLGWAYCLWERRGSFQEWYFAGYQFIYLLWPWKMDIRYFLPVAPLACLYLWQGLRACKNLAKENPRLLGAILLPVSVVLTAGSLFWVHREWLAGLMVRGRGLQVKVALAAWITLAAVSGLMMWSGSSWRLAVSAVKNWWERPRGFWRTCALGFCVIAAGAMIASLIGTGLEADLEIGRDNVDVNSRVNRTTPDAEAAEWVHFHTGRNAVIMARHVPITYYYAERKIVWFPPSTDAQLLMAGIREHKVDYVLAVNRKYNYYLPPDPESMAPLLAANPESFRLIEQTPDYRIFQVVSEERPAQERAAQSTTDKNPHPRGS